jgi:hypothetical protein
MKYHIKKILLLPLIVLLLGLAACSPELKQSDFIGKWRSSKASTPIYLDANGEWEIRSDDGTVLQYGIWRYDNHKIMWTVKIGGSYRHEANEVVNFASGEFKLKELDGSETTFQKLN